MNPPIVRGNLSSKAYVAVLECPAQYQFARTGHRQHRSVWSAVGNAVHAVAAIADEEVAADEDSEPAAVCVERRCLHSLTVREQQVAMPMVKTMVERLPEPVPMTLVQQEREQLFTFYDEVTLWNLNAQPDEVDQFRSPDGVLTARIVDLKVAGNPRLKKVHKKRRLQMREYRRQMEYSALVWTLSQNWQGPVQLVVRCLQSEPGQQNVEWTYLPQQRNSQMLADVRNVIKSIEQYRQSGVFPAVVTTECVKCSFKDGCGAYHERLDARRRQPPNTLSARRNACAS